MIPRPNAEPTALGFGGLIVVCTFLSLLLTDITGVPQKTVNIALLLLAERPWLEILRRKAQRCRRHSVTTIAVS